MDKLTPKQKAFADNYIQNGGNAEKAAVEAGYSKNYARSYAYKILANVGISNYIAEKQAEIEKQNGHDIMTLTEIQERRSRIGKGLEVDSFGFAADFSSQLKAMSDLEKILLIKQEKEEKQRAAEEARNAAHYHTDLDIIADTFHPIVRSMRRKEYNEYCFVGGRGSAKSSCGTIIPYELMKNNPNVHAIALRQVKDTLRDSIYAQFQWSAEMQAENPMFDRENWEFKLSPLEITYKPTGQKIYFRGADDPGKIKSIKVPFGYIGIIVWEEFDQFLGEEPVRKIEQSVIRGGDFVWNIKIMNPPISIHNWANNYMNIPKQGKIVHKSTYKDLPPEWLGKAFLEEAEHLKEVNPAAYEHEYLGEPIGLGTEIFKFLEIRTITDDEVKVQEKIFQGQDWGWEPDPKAFIRCSYSHATEKIMLLDEMGGTCIRTKDMAQQIADKGYNDYTIYCGADEQEHITDFRDFGLPARQAFVGSGSVRRTFEWLQCRTIVIDPARTPRAYKEFTKYEHDLDKNGEVIDGYPDHDNHWIDALRYATSPLSMRRGNSA
ncbi:MAG: phage terminase large subunit [Bacteroidales bacterium]|nr:phage terminase large subunit [Lachnoclostridium sp.]MCM1385290.1 phage terminase large subunit [Lachnoclostridium sp.]MCM1466124.1 phage terminase large subunit [Bacteroidales bacterium]